MDERQIHLRIKVKSLIEESRIIRSEAKKTTGMVKWGLNQHRKTVVRTHTRHNLLAYGLLRGVPYFVMEKRCAIKPDFDKVYVTAKRFGGDKKIAAKWVKEAKEYLAPKEEPQAQVA
jgi:hypothetical protein